MSSNLVTENYPLISVLDLSDDDYEDRLRRLQNDYSELLANHKEAIPKGAIYLNGYLHDSWVISLDYGQQYLAIWLNEFSTHCFVDAYAEAYGIKVPHRKRIMPLCLRFVGLKRCQVYRIKKGMKMIAVSSKKYLRHISEYLMDEITDIGNEHISIGMLFYNNELPRDRRELLLQVYARHLVIEEHQSQAFLELFGNDHIRAFDSYWNERQQGHYFDYSSALSFLTNHKGLVPDSSCGR